MQFGPATRGCAWIQSQCCRHATQVTTRRQTARARSNLHKSVCPPVSSHAVGSATVPRRPADWCLGTKAGGRGSLQRQTCQTKQFEERDDRKVPEPWRGERKIEREGEDSRWKGQKQYNREMERALYPSQPLISRALTLALSARLSLYQTEQSALCSCAGAYRPHACARGLIGTHSQGVVVMVVAAEVRCIRALCLLGPRRA
jgi:hypothetical protein